PFRTRAASPPSGQSSVQTVLRWSSVAAAHHFLFRVSPASADWQRAAATLPIRIPLPDSPPRQAVAPQPQFSPCPARKPSAPALRSPAHASTSRRKVHLAPAAPRPTKPGQVAREEVPPAPLPPNLPPRSDTWLPELAAIHIALRAHHPRSKSSSSSFFLTSLLLFFLPSEASR